MLNIANKRTREKIEVFEMMCLRNVSSIRSDLQIRGKCGWELNVMERIEQNVLKYFGHAGTMGEERPD